MSDDGSDDLVLDAARACRPYLASLVPAGDVADVNDALRAALERADAQDVGEELEALFDEYPALQDWVAAFVEHGVPPEFVEYAERSARPPGDPAPLPPPARYVCPVDGNYVRFARLAFQPAGTCPEHGVELVPVGVP